MDAVTLGEPSRIPVSALLFKHGYHGYDGALLRDEQGHLEADRQSHAHHSARSDRTTYYDSNAVMREIYDARVWAGLHWRHSMLDGAQVGRKVSKYVCDHFFLPLQ